MKQQDRKNNEKYVTSFGEEVTVWAVPQQIIRSVIPERKKPERPSIEMQLPKGQVQKRFIKKEDPGWEEYTDQLTAWEEEKNELQEAVTFCLALKSYPFPDNLKLSPELEDLVSTGLLEIPKNPYLKKLFWLRENVIGQHDEFNIRWIVQKLSGVPEEVIEEMKDSFRNYLLGKTTERLGDNSPKPDQTEEAS